MTAPDAQARFATPRCPVEAMRLQRLGALDPTLRLDERQVLRACHTPAGPGTLRLRWDGTTVLADAWGPGAGWLVSRAPAISGAQDEPTALVAREPWLEQIVRTHEHVALGRAPRLFDTLVAYVLQQRVPFIEAAASWRRLVEQHGHGAPGPHGLRLPLTPQQWKGLSSAVLASFDVDRQRGAIVHEVALHARKIDALDEAPLSDARALLPKLRGIGPWTQGIVLGVGRGDPDAVPVGDFAMPSLVTRAFTGQPRGDDRQMLQLLEPYRGQRFRVMRLLFAAGYRRQRLGPRRGRSHGRRGYGR